MRRFRIFMVVLLAVSWLTPASADFDSLRMELRETLQRAEQQGIRLSVGVRGLAGAYRNETLLLGDDLSYPPASTIKVLLIAALMQQVDAGRLTLQQTTPVTPEDVVGGYGVLQDEVQPQDVTLGRLAELTVTISDNTATNVLVDVVGYPAMAGLAGQLGLELMYFGRKMFEAPVPPDKDNFINAPDSLALLTAIYDGSFLSDESRDQIMAWLSEQTVKTKIAAGVPEGVSVAHKTGENGPVSHDIGFILLPEGALAVAIFAENLNNTDFDASQAQLNPRVAEIANAIYQHLSR
jgi:beta-lactamase class A